MQFFDHKGLIYYNVVSYCALVPDRLLMKLKSQRQQL